MRILSLNVAKISVQQLHKMGGLLSNEEKYGVDVMLIQEHNINFGNKSVFPQIHRTIKHFWQYNIFVPSSTPDAFQTTHQPGGTMIVINSSLYQRVQKR